jgi:hypothetical protein
VHGIGAGSSTVPLQSSSIELHVSAVGATFGTHVIAPDTQ